MAHFLKKQGQEEQQQIKVIIRPHRHHSVHIEKECCLGPALADIWLLLI